MKSAIVKSVRSTWLRQQETTVDEIRSTNRKLSKTEKKILLIPAQLDWLGFLMMAQSSTNLNVDEG